MVGREPSMVGEQYAPHGLSLLSQEASMRLMVPLS